MTMAERAYEIVERGGDDDEPVFARCEHCRAQIQMTKRTYSKHDPKHQIACDSCDRWTHFRPRNSASVEADESLTAHTEGQSMSRTTTTKTREQRIREALAAESPKSTLEAVRHTMSRLGIADPDAVLARQLGIE